MLIKFNMPSDYDYYMFFNKKTSFNSETVEGGDQVLITGQGQEGNGFSPSELLVKLSSNQIVTHSLIMIVVNSIGSRASISICYVSCSFPPGPSLLPSSAPSPIPTLSLSSIPSLRPSLIPLIPPTSSPNIPNVCSDSPLSLAAKVNDLWYWKDCSWVSQQNNAQKICSYDGISEYCPLTCNTCSVCLNSPLMFYVQISENSARWKYCDWVATNPNANCLLPGVKDTCRQLCGNC